ncbi:PREDICTED: A-kinase-interacting protein 1-like [Chrysochloris asiatica]|uniref:A-kinase-interacting protein 1-like n=1 Tax=Chrysochloris asiatica TaxID=185453 RepID=A0A9B0TMD6_CHRAS|nr:PREDICTED: A-kinase-interacting protein 1-like [Chrysochloris asiatica]
MDLVLEWAMRRVVNWHLLELPNGSMGVSEPQQLLPGEKSYSSVPEEGGATHIY